MQNDIIQIITNSSAVVGILSAIGFIVMLCVKPLRAKLVEYIILKHDKEQFDQKIAELEAVITDQTAQINQLQELVYKLTTEVNDLKVQLAKYEALVGPIK